MREILFRGKDIKGKWHIGLLAHIGNAWYISNEAGVSTAFEVIPETVGQYTGLTAYWYAFENEPQEADIWEHDLLEVDYEDKKVIAKVVFEVEAGMFILCSNEFADSYIPLFDVVEPENDYSVNAKKLGNIHDNPELLKGGC